MLKNTSTSYGTITKSFHWIMAILIIGVVIAGFTMTRLEPSDLKWSIYGNHKAVGVILLCLIPLRILWRLISKIPKLPKTVPGWQRLAANANIFILYILMVVMPLSGFLMSTMGGRSIDMFGVFTIESFEKNQSVSSQAHDIHMTVAWVIAGLIILHTLGALYHHFIHKDNVLKRMLPRFLSK